MTKVISKVSTFFVIFPSVVALCLALLLGSSRRTHSSEFTAALDQYQRGELAEAKLKFENFSQDSGWQFPALFNLGNIALRQSHPGEALGYFKRAQLINPLDKDVRHNIEFIAKTLGLRQHREESSGLWSMIESHSIAILPLRVFTALILIFSTLALYLGRQRLQLGAEFKHGGAFVVFIILFLGASFLGGLKLINSLNERAIITDKKVDVKSGPSSEHATLLDISEGLEVEVEARRDDWIQVNLQGDTTGWVPAKAVMMIAN